MEEIKRFQPPAPPAPTEGDPKARIEPAPIKAAEVEAKPRTEPAPAKPAKKTYVGPAYKFGITLPGTIEQIRPKDMTPVEIAELIKRYPPAAAWWQ